MTCFTRSIYPRVRLRAVESDRFKTNYMTVNFLLPLQKGEPAMTSLLPKVLRCGTVSYPDMASLARQYDLLYATNIEPFRQRRGDVECFGFGCTMLRQEYIPDGTDIQSGVFSLLRELIFAPHTENGTFSEAYVENEKRVLIDTIRAEINNKIKYAVTRCVDEMCRDELYSLPVNGTEDEVNAITASTLFDYYHKVLQNAQIEIFFMGQCNTDALCASLADLFAPMQGEGADLGTTFVKRAHTGEVKTVKEEQPVTQGKLSLGFRTGLTLGDADYTALSMFLTVYGSSPISKLFMNVREKLSLCYYCTAIPEGQKGIMIVTSGIENQNFEIARDEILHQLKCIQNGEITEQELMSAKAIMINSCQEMQDSPAALESWYMNRALARIEDTPEALTERVMAIEKEDIVRVSKNVTLDTVYFMEGTQKEESTNE